MRGKKAAQLNAEQPLKLHLPSLSLLSSQTDPLQHVWPRGPDADKCSCLSDFLSVLGWSHTTQLVIVFRLVNACTYSAKMKLYEVKTSAANVLEADFTEV